MRARLECVQACLLLHSRLSFLPWQKAAAPLLLPADTPLPCTLLPLLQFKDRTVSRSYVAITLGVPRPPEGRVATNIGRCVGLGC